jgi:hypothetical protein
VRFDRGWAGGQQQLLDKVHEVPFLIRPHNNPTAPLATAQTIP